MQVARSHYFIDLAGTPLSQSDSQSFGPVKNNETTQYRVTAKFNPNGDKMAFALCKSSVLIVPEYDYSVIPAVPTGRVNLILKPHSQPLTDVSIKYVVYRGLKKGDFIDSNNIVITSSSNTSDFINKVNSDFSDLNSGTSPLPDFSASYLGYFDTLLWDDDKQLDDVFFKQVSLDENGVEPTEQAFELPLINSGFSLGTFTGTECGIDIVLDNGNLTIDSDISYYPFDMQYARSSEIIIDISDAGLTEIEKKCTKERILQFVDIAAFFGIHTENEQSSITYSDTSNASNPVNEISGDEINHLFIYTSFLQPFFTSNNWYVSIISNRHRTYNFYGNYSFDQASPLISFRYGETELTLSDEVYGTYGWPILIYSNSQVQTGTLFLQFPNTRSTQNTLFFVYTGNVVNLEDERFGFPELLIDDAEINESISITKPIELSCSNIEVNSVFLNISTLNILHYYGSPYPVIVDQTTDSNNNNVLSTFEMLTDSSEFFGEVIFGHLKGVIEHDILEHLISYKGVVLNHLIDEQSVGLTFNFSVREEFNTGTESLIAYTSFPTEVIGNIMSLKNNISTEIPNILDSIVGQLLNEGSDANNGMKVISFPFIGELGPMTGLLLVMENDTLATSRIYGITSEEEDQIKATWLTLNGSNPRLLLKSRIQDLNLTNLEEEFCYAYDAFIVYESEDGSLLSHGPILDLTLYSKDNRIYFTEEFSNKFIYEPSQPYMLKDDITY